MLVKLKALVLELITRSRFARRPISMINWGSTRSTRQKPHHRMSVMPRRCVLQKLSRLIADHTKQRCPVQQFGVAYLVKLLDGQSEERIGIAQFQFPDEPSVELELGLRIFPGARIVRHASAGQNCNSLRP